MLESYIENFDPEKEIESIRKKKNLKTRAEALTAARKEIPKESYFQDKIRRRITREYPSSFCRKIAQGAYAEAGIPDLLVIYQGHYFGFEVKRPLVGKLSAIQQRTIDLIERSGGTARVVFWPEEAIETIEEWRKENGL